ncbi:hypothetical protein GCM10009737_16990 [Nocardioides lentus]|uniref:PASTA domain-containing protein n=1 Tax=Nocardioides lentus TaxID=338077 RepID=A0ABN2PBK5_9ACTN
MRSKQTLALAASSLALTAVLAGCSGDDEPESSPSPSGSSADAPSSDDASADGGVVSEDGQSRVYQSVPPGFPDDVPILDDSEATGSVSEYDGLTAFSVVMPSDGETVPTLQEAAELVAAEGFEGSTEVSAEGNQPQPVVLRSDDPATTVIISGTDLEGGGTLLTYTVEVS